MRTLSWKRMKIILGRIAIMAVSGERITFSVDGCNLYYYYYDYVRVCPF